MRKEYWRIIPGWDNYMVSDLGRVKCLDFHRTGKEGILKPFKDSNGRLQVELYRKGETWQPHVHKLVADAFIPNPENKPEIHHINNDCTDNRVENLLRVTKAEHDALHLEDGTRGKKISMANTNGKLSKRVRQMTLDRKEVRIWPSLQEIERSKGWSHRNISSGIRTGGVRYGHYWEFA